MIALAVVQFLAGLSLAWAGWRGARFGNDPHCRACGFNLRGRDPASTRCSECGADLSDVKAIQSGQWRRQGRVLLIGLALLLAGGLGLAWGGSQWARDYDFEPWKPASWLVDDADSNDPILRDRSRIELMRRTTSAAVSQARADAVVDRLLDRQADRSKKWDEAFGETIEKGALAHRVDRARLERYLRQGLTAKFQVKPKIRRGQELLYNLEFDLDRYGESSNLAWNWHLTPLQLDNIDIAKEWFPGDHEESMSRGVGYSGVIPRASWNADRAPDGSYVMRSKATWTLRMTSPIEIGPVNIDLPLSARTELLPAGTKVDEFTADPSRRQAMRSGIAATRVVLDENGNVEVRTKAGDLPIGIAADVFLVQGAAEQKLGSLRIDANSPPRWYRTQFWDRPRFSGAVDVQLRPSQEPADATLTLSTYWDEPIVIPSIVIGAPYDVPFNNDPTLRAAVEKSVKTPKITASPARGKKGGNGALIVNLANDATNVKLAYNVFLRQGNREVKAMHWEVSPSSSGHGHSSGAPDIDPAGKADRCDVILRPNPDWEVYTSDLVPPWGGEMIFHDVPIK